VPGLSRRRVDRSGRFADDPGMTDQSTSVAQLRQLIADFVAAREWNCYHDPKNLAMSIAIEAAELMEHFQWVRSEETAAVLANAKQRAEIIDEVADVACYVLSLANALQIDLSSAVAAKVAKNAEKYPVERFRGRYFKPGAP
jgi:NTP pyrophosphatase (non-canonical NTP hydrolase)